MAFDLASAKPVSGTPAPTAAPGAAVPAQRVGFDLASARDVGAPAEPAAVDPGGISLAARQGYGRGGRAPDPALLAEQRRNPDALTRTIQGAIDDPVGTATAGAAGINRGVADLAGLPVDTAQDLVDLPATMLGPIVAERVPSRPIPTRPGVRMFDVDENGKLVPSRTFESRRIPDDLQNVSPRGERGELPFSGDWNARMLDKAATSLGGGTVTQNPRPDNPAARLVYSIGQAVPGAVTARGLASNVAGGAAQGIVAEAGGGPLAQTAAALAGGRVVPEGGAPRSVPRETPPPITETPDQVAPPRQAQAAIPETGPVEVQVFHGTNAPEFGEFKVGHAPGWGPGIYLTDTAESAGQFGNRVIPATVSLKNPYRGERIPDETLEGTKAYSAVKERWPDVRDAWQEDSSFVGAALRELGYDGVVTRDSNDVQGTEIVAFSPAQVRKGGKPPDAPLTATGAPRSLPREPAAAPAPQLSAAGATRATPYTDLEGAAISRRPPVFVDDTPVAEGGAQLGMGDQARRKDILRRVGVGELRNSAVQGNAKAASTDFQMSKLDDPRGQHISRVLNAEREAITNFAERVVRETGGTRGTGQTENLQRGQNIVAPLDGIKDHFDAQTKALYKVADERAKGRAFDTKKVRELVGDESEFLGTVEGEALLRGARARMKSLKMTDADGTPKRTTVKEAERMKQWLNDSWTPRTSRLVKRFKEAIDDDVLASAGEDIYARARALRAERARILDDPKGIAQIMDAEGPQGINRAVAVERIGDVITTLPVAQFSHIVKTLNEAPAELRGPAQAALAEIKSQFANKVHEIGSKTQTQWNARGVSKYLNDNSARLRVLFTPDELRKFADLNDAGHILRFESSYPGAAVQAENLKRAAAVEHGTVAAGTAIGAGVGGPFGAMVGAGVGKVLGDKMGKGMRDRAGLKAARARTTDLRTEPQNALARPSTNPRNSLQRDRD